MTSGPEEALHAYARAFESLDPEAVVPFYHLPCLFIGPPGVSVVSDIPAARALASALIEHARSQGYRRSEILGLESRAQGDGLASLWGTFVRLDANDAEISRFGFAYTWRRDDAGWKIVVAAAHAVAGA